MTILTAALIVSCTEEIDDSNNNSGPQEQNVIQFAVDDTQDWYQTNREETTRAARQEAFASKEIPMTSETGAADMDACLVPTVVNGINTVADGMTSVATRGAVATEVAGPMGITAYTYNNSETWGTQTPDATFYNETATKSNGSWGTANTHLWPEDVSKTMQFFAYTPYQNDNGISLSAASEAGTPYIDFTVQDAIDQQVDLMTAASGPQNKRSLKVELPFRHVLTCVKFAVGNSISPSGTIKEIRLLNIVKAGRYHFDGNWEPTVATKKDQYAISGISTSTSSAGTVLTGTGGVAGSTLLMIPQQFTDANQKVEVDVLTATGIQTITASLNGTQWLPGTTVTYNISGKAGNWDYVLTVTPARVSYHGGEATFAVTSYRQNTGGTSKTAVPWEITGYSIDGGTTFTAQRPDGCEWLRLITRSGNGGTAEELGVVKVDEQTAASSTALNSTTDKANQATQLKNNPARGTSGSYYDLSTHDFEGNSTLQNTANCYIVNAPGYYKIPLVYGNAIVDGQPNTLAYTDAKYVDHDGQTITSPYLYETRNKYYTIASAQVVWQDEQNLVSSVGLSSDKHYIQFYVSPDNIKQGNAVIGVRSQTTYSGQLNYMWSWHIWVTNTDLTKTVAVKNHEGYVYRFLPVNLGWCSEGSTQTTYAERSIVLKVQQQNGKTAHLVVSQPEMKTFTEATVGNNTYYQSRRKDPFPCGTNNGGTKTIYGTYTKTEGQKGVPWGIRNPSDFRYVPSNGSLRDWLTTAYASPKLWCVGYTFASAEADNYCNYKVIKTIYDPSPVGFKMPPPRALSGFSTTGESPTTTSQWNATSTVVTTYNGFYFKTGYGSETMFFPATGRMAWESGVIDNSGTQQQARIWMAIPYNAENGNTLSAVNNTLTLSKNAHLGVGLPVRPIVDE